MYRIQYRYWRNPTAYFAGYGTEDGSEDFTVEDFVAYMTTSRVDGGEWTTIGDLVFEHTEHHQVIGLIIVNEEGVTVWPPTSPSPSE